MKIRIFFLLIFLSVSILHAAPPTPQWCKDGNVSYTCTLKNGLKVILIVNKNNRFRTFMAIRLGCNNDPDNNTDFDHYHEHMLFKGTDKLRVKTLSLTEIFGY